MPYPRTAWILGACALLLDACGWMPGSPALKPFMATATAPEAVLLEEPLAVGLIWLKPAEGSVTLPARVERAALETIRSHFAEAGKMLRVVYVQTAAVLDLPTLRQLGEAHAVTHVLVVVPTVEAIAVPFIPLMRGFAPVGTRTESYVLLEAVVLDLATGAALFAARGNGVAALWALDTGPFGPWYPYLTRGTDRHGFGGRILPEGEEFPPGEVHAVALHDAVQILLGELGRVGTKES